MKIIMCFCFIILSLQVNALEIIGTVPSDFVYVTMSSTLKATKKIPFLCKYGDLMKKVIINEKKVIVLADNSYRIIPHRSLNMEGRSCRWEIERIELLFTGYNLSKNFILYSGVSADTEFNFNYSDGINLRQKKAYITYGSNFVVNVTK